MLNIMDHRTRTWSCRKHSRVRPGAKGERFRFRSSQYLLEPLEPRVLLSTSLFEKVDFALEKSSGMDSTDYPAGLIAVDLNNDDLLDLVTANVGSVSGEKNLLNLQFGS